LYGTNWNKRVVDIADAFFSNYTIGSALTSGSIPAGSLVKNEGAADVYYYDGSAYRKIASESAFNANRFQFSNVLTVSNAITASGSSIASAELVNVAQNGETTGPVVTGSGLAISLSSATPASASVPKTAERIPALKVNLTAASDGAVTLNSLTVKRIGLSDYNDIDKVWAEYEGETIASKKDVNSNDEATLVFSPALTINAGQTKTIDLIFSLTNADGNIGLSIASASAVSATAASVTGSFPVSGNLLSPTTYSVTNVKVATSSTVSKETIDLGEEAVELGKFDIKYVSSERDITVSSIKLKNSGSEDLIDAVSNLYLETDGEKVAEGVIDGKYVTFTFDGGFKMTKDNGDQAFTIYGDIIGKEISGTSGITLAFNKTEDLVAKETSNGFGVVVTNTVALTVSDFNIKSGAVNVSAKSTNPDDDEVIAGTNGIVALLANIKADEAINAEGLEIQVVKAASTSFENIRVYLNGILVDSFDPAYNGDLITLDSSVSLNKGDNEVKVTVDTTSNASTSAEFQVKLDASAGIKLLDSPEYSNGNSVSSSEIDGSATGAILTIAGASASVVRTDGYASTKTAVQGSTGISLGKFTVKAKSDDVTITKIVVASTTGNTLPYSSTKDVKIMVDGSQVGTTKSFTSTGVTFSSLSVKVAKDATKVIEIIASTDTAATGTLKVKATFTAKDSNGDNVNISGDATTVAYNITDEASLTIAKDGNSTDSALLAAKAGVEQTIATFKLTANNDEANVTSMTVTNGTDADVRIASYKLYDNNGNLLDEANPFSGTTEFTISDGALKIAADASKVVTVKAVLNNIENDATATDKVLQLTVTELEFKSTNGSKTTMNSTAIGTVKSNEFRIRKTVPTVALASLPSTTLTSGNQVISKFTIAADSNADVKVAKLAIKYATSSAKVSMATTSAPVKINGVSKSTNVTSAIATSTTGGWVIIDFGTSTPEIVSAGTSKTFEVVTNVTVSGSDRESLSTSIEEATTAGNTIDATEYATAGTMVWTDSASNTDASNIWFDSYRVKGLPSDTQTMSAN